MAFDINMQFSDNGISPAKIALDANNNIIFTDKDYFIIEPCKGSVISRTYFDYSTNEEMKMFDRMHYEYFNGYPSGSSIEATIKYVGSEIGVVLRYSYEGFLIMRFNGTSVSLYKVVNQEITQIGRDVPCLLVRDTTYTIEAEDATDKIKLYIDGVYRTNFIITNGIIDDGLFGIYGTPNTVCTGYKIKTQVPNNWTKIGSPIVIGYPDSQDNDSSVILSIYGDNSNNANYLKQTISVTPGKKHSFLLKAGGEFLEILTYIVNNNADLSMNEVVELLQTNMLKLGGVTHVPQSNMCRMHIVNAANGTILYQQEIHSAEFYAMHNYYGSFNVPAGCDQVEIRLIPSSNSTVGIDRIQLNEGDVSPFVRTGNTPVTTGESIIRLPVNIDNFEDIAVSLDVKAYSDNNNAKNVLFSVSSNDESEQFIMYYNADNKVCIDYKSGGGTHTYVTEIIIPIMSYIKLKMLLKNGTATIESDEFDPILIISSGSNTLVPGFSTKYINLGYSTAQGYSRGNACFDNFTISKLNKVLYNYDFDGGIQELTHGVAVYVPGQPTQFAPISVEYEDGTKIYRISSYDETGKYTRMAIEYVKYAGQKKLTVSCSDIESEYNIPIAIIEADNNENVREEIAFEATTVDGNTIYLNMTDEQSTKYIGKNMRVIYVPRNSYSITYGEDNSFNIHLHSHKGSPVNVSFEQSERDKSIIKSANMNPFYNPNHTGFLYLSDEMLPTSFINVMVSPRYIDGRVGEYAIITIDAFDKTGNIVSDASFSMRTSGSINAEIVRIRNGEDLEKLGETSKVDIQFCAGMYVYAYKLKQSYVSTSSYIIKDVITIVEDKTKVTESTNIFVYV